MIRTTPRIFLVVVLVGGIAGVGCSNSEHDIDNVVIILIDTLRQDHLAIYDYPRTTSPTIDRLGRSGAVVDGVSPTSWTKPATASLLTGLHPLRHQAINYDDRLIGDVVTLAEVLDATGMNTLGVIGNGFVSEKFGFEQGFDEYIYVARKPGPGPTIAEELNKRVLPRLAALKSPYFLYIHYVDPHAPYDPPITWEGEPLGSDLKRWAPLGNFDLNAVVQEVPSKEMLSAAIDLYDGEIRYVDREISVVLDELERLGLMDSTLTIVTADHGEEFGEHLRIGHGRTLYEEVTRVPLVFHAPGLIPAGTRLGSINLLDVAPTILEILGVPSGSAEGWDPDGVSVASSLTGDAPEIRTRDDLLHLDYQGKASLGLLRGDLKLILEQRPIYGKHLYDVEKDPLERENLFSSGDYLAIIKEMSLSLANDFNRLYSMRFSAQTAMVDSETRDALAAMGYVESEDETSSRSISGPVRPADDFLGGLLGWEDVSSISECVQFGMPESDHQLLFGWGQPEPVEDPVGRWSRPYSTMLINIPEDAENRTLRIVGSAIGHSRFSLSFRTEDQVLVTRYIRESGPFEINKKLPTGMKPGPTLIIVGVEPPWKPRRMWKNKDWLGTFINSVCVAD